LVITFFLLSLRYQNQIKMNLTTAYLILTENKFRVICHQEFGLGAKKTIKELRINDYGTGLRENAVKVRALIPCLKVTVCPNSSAIVITEA
jgi:hypothetical protein